MRISDNSTNEELIEFAKDQCEIFPEDSHMGKYLRETVKILEDELTLSNKIKLIERKRLVFNSISNFARANVVKIDFDFDFLGNLTITMTRKSHTISRTISRAISNSELNWIEDCENTIFYYLNVMLTELIESEEKE